MKIKFIQKPLPTEKDKAMARVVFQTIKKRLPSSAKILCLSLTGSKAFGWGGEKFDFDVHGIFAVNIPYWDWIHAGITPFDINMHDLTHVFESVYYQGCEFLTSMANPFYLDPGFDYKGMMKFIPRFVEKNAVLSEMKRFEINPTARAALHCYRILLNALNIMDRKKIEINIFKIVPHYNIKMPYLLKDIYNAGGNHFDVEKVKKEIEYLFSLYEKKMLHLADTPSKKGEIKEWIARTAKKYKMKSYRHNDDGEMIFVK